MIGLTNQKKEVMNEETKPLKITTVMNEESKTVMNEESKQLKITCGAIGTLVALVGSHVPLVLADDIDLNAIDNAEVPVTWLDYDGDLQTADLDIRLLVDWTPPENVDRNAEILGFLREMVERFAPPLPAAREGAEQPEFSMRAARERAEQPEFSLWPERDPGKGTP